MSVSPTGLNMNWENVAVTPNGGSAIAINEVTALSLNRASRHEEFYGDNRYFAKMIRAVELKRMISISSGNSSALELIPDDAPCTVTGTLADARNGIVAGGGAIIVTLVNAVLEKQGTDGQNNKFAQNSVSFNSYGAVGTGGVEIDPLTLTFA